MWGEGGGLENRRTEESVSKAGRERAMRPERERGREGRERARERGRKRGGEGERERERERGREVERENFVTQQPFHPSANRPDIIFAVDWALKTSYLSTPVPVLTI